MPQTLIPEAKVLRLARLARLVRVMRYKIFRDTWLDWRDFGRICCKDFDLRVCSAVQRQLIADMYCSQRARDPKTIQ